MLTFISDSRIILTTRLSLFHETVSQSFKVDRSGEHQVNVSRECTQLHLQEGGNLKNNMIPHLFFFLSFLILQIDIVGIAEVKKGNEKIEIDGNLKTKKNNYKILIKLSIFLLKPGASSE